MTSDPGEIAAALTYRLKNPSWRGDFPAQVCVVKKGPRAYKSASLMTFVDPATNEIRKRELRVQTWNARPAAEGGGYDFTETTNAWHCEDDEIEAIRAFLNGELAEEGDYRLIRSGSDFDRLVTQIETNEIEVEDLARLLGLAANATGLIDALASQSQGVLLAEAVELRRRRDQLMTLRAIVEEPTQNEHHIHAQLKTMGWVFGGRYVGEAVRRQLTTEDSLDIPLLRPDGSLHVVELKKAQIPKLIVKNHSHGSVGEDINLAVGQTMNYLRSLDEERYTILGKYEIDPRRASATVIIGHPKFVTGFDAQQVAETLRTYNSHLSRIQVLHYRDLIESAERALALSAADEGHDQSSVIKNGRSGQQEPNDPWELSPQPPPDEPPF